MLAVIRWALPVLLLVLCQPQPAAAEKVKLPAAFINDNVVRNLDISHSAMREKRVVAITPAPDAATSTKKKTATYWLAVEVPAEASQLMPNFTIAHVSAHGKDATDKAAQTLTAAHTEEIDGRIVHLFPYTLLNPSGRPVVIFDIVYTHAYQPHPQTVSQDEKQLLRVFTNAHMPSPYATNKQKLKISLASATVQSFTQVPAPATKSGKTITYGPYEGQQVPAYSYAPASIHCENNTPLVTVTSLQRDLWLSMWGGNLAVDEFYAIRHDGAIMKNQFSRIDFTHKQATHHMTGVLKSLQLELPPMASEPYYRDDVGNVSTSNFRSELRRSVLEIRPRFPIFGGWVYNWNHGYNVPLSSYLSVGTGANRGRLVFQAPFIKSFDDATIDEITVRVVLPEGATDVRTHLPFPVDSVSATTTFTYLDSLGRTTVILRTANVVAEHSVPFQISFEHPARVQYAKPLFLAVGSLLIFALNIAYWRSNFVIGASTVTVVKSKAD